MSAAWMIGSLASALGIGVGGGLAWILNKIQRGYGYIYSLCAGLIMGLLFLEMMPDSIKLGGWVVFVLGIGTGLLLFMYVHQLLGSINTINNSNKRNMFIRSGLLLTISIMIHNFPVGIAFGSTIGTEMGNSMLITLVLHNIPEGIIIFTPLFLAGFGLVTWILFTTITATPIAVGAWLGQYVKISSPQVLAFMINIAIYIIFMVAIKEILWEALKRISPTRCFTIGGFGFAIIFVYLALLH
ncbi:ZIP family metal transporter [Virgibacillus byunsanensis]|uniref:ZIP family metal transporter n=1 Tax=Virgibacillus byunsanensis TaxID=570945 RepID=A0ABW3LPD2_9BACI